jgi:hypothetical protein
LVVRREAASHIDRERSPTFVGTRTNRLIACHAKITGIGLPRAMTTQRSEQLQPG